MKSETTTCTIDDGENETMSFNRWNQIDLYAAYIYSRTLFYFKLYYILSCKNDVCINQMRI